MTITIRGYQPDDLETLRAITVEAFEGVSIDRIIESQFGPIGDHDWKWRKARHMDEDCRREPQGVFVAEAADRIVGYITTWMDREASIGYIPNLAVDHARRGQGIGRQLIEHALSHFRTQQMAYARIETLEQNPIGQSFYPSLGFRELARQIHYGMEL